MEHELIQGRSGEQFTYLRDSGANAYGSRYDNKSGHGSPF
ncbi:hypothetical protein OP10G_3841 [Fimbriimonas ginsengisoli Gsoil 348]|uniref:Uncharacterized protein n=1 Tax=Fimbriimonas ginsengisoli Gsoil 348 TaxID=661478 RepID=A0A068NYQ0_FIMGI|nr:hypothetical protein OP10G_3841 [Fimbriimonas ginsengisoli Gsoil 348]